jgi:glycosyltransferase involved in cell wall biosynthesis
VSRAAPVRVLHLLGPSAGGIRRHVAFLAEALARRRWSVEVAGPAGVLPEASVVPVPSGVASPGWLAARRALRPLAARADLVHAHGLKAGWLASTLRPRPPLVVSVHNLVLDEAAGRGAPFLRALEGWLPRRVDRIVAVSGEVARRFAGARVPVDVVPPAGPPPQPRRSRAEVRRALGAEDRPLVVTVARLHPQKGLDTLLDAASLLRGARLAIVGEGPLEAQLREAVRARGLEGTVLLAGPSAEAADELAAADVVAIPSRWESGPLVAVEAMLLGRPVGATPW